MSICRETMVTPTHPAAPALRRMLAGTTALTTAAVCGWLLTTDPAWADLPTGGTVLEGSAEITYGVDSVTIQQGSDRVIIEWDTFDVGEGNSVNFLQQDFMVALNRVLNGGPSEILGSINAGGTVIISNPAGVVFGPNASVDVQSIVATSLGIMNDRFMAGDLVFDQAGDPTAVVSNAGEITVAEAGLAALVAPGVQNSGVIRAQAGTVALASGRAVTIDLYGDGLVSLAVTAPTLDVPVDAQGNPLDALVANMPEGEIYADAGTVILTAEAAAGIVDNVINMDGVVMANSIHAVGGQVALVGGQHGTVRVAGDIIAQGDDEDEAGGTVHVLGEAVVLADGADIDVSGEAGGGDILLGGDYQGGPQRDLSGLQYLEPAAGGGTVISTGPTMESIGYIQTADITYFDGGATASADATDDGDGGTVILWADEALGFYGTISADGGANGGDGGFVETSSPGVLDIPGTVTASAVNGLAGQWLLDPLNLTVVDTLSGDEIPPVGTDPLEYLSSLTASEVLASTIVASLNGGTSVTLLTGDGGTEAGDIAVNAAIETTTTAAGVTLTLEAHNDIDVNAAISDDGEGLTLVLHANIDQLDASGSAGGDDGGTIIIDAAIDTNGGDVTLIADEFDINTTVAAGVGTVTVQRASLGRLVVGNNYQTAQADVTDGELARISASSLVFGNPTAADNLVTLLEVASFDYSATVPGLVQFNALGGGGAYIVARDTLSFDSVEFNANDGVTFTGDSTVTTTAGDAIFNVDADGTGVVGAFDDLRAQTGVTAVINSAADIRITTPAYTEINTGTISLNATDAITFARSSTGTIGVGDGATGGLSFTDAQLARMTAATINFGDPTTPNNTTAINVADVDLSRIGTAAFNTDGTTTFTGDSSFAALVTTGGTTTVSNGATVGATATIAFDTSTVNLDGNLTATGGISGTATNVNVIGDTGGAEIQDAIDVALDDNSGDSPVTITVAAGTYAGFEVDKQFITVDGAGAATIIEAASPAVTINADNATIRDMALRPATVATDPVGILLDGTNVTTGLTGIEIVNVDFVANLTDPANPVYLVDGIRSQGNIGAGTGTAAAPDVLIRGTSSTDKSVFEDLLDAAIDVGDTTDGDAVYVVQDVTVQDGDDDGSATGGAGFRFGAIGGVTVSRATMSDVVGGGIDFAAALDSGDAVLIEDSEITSTGINGDAVRFGATLTGASVTIAGNTLNGRADGIAFDESVTNTTVLIGGDQDGDANTIIGGADFEFDSGVEVAGTISGGQFLMVGNTRISGYTGIFLSASITDATVLIAGNGGIAADEGIFGLGTFGDAVLFNGTLTNADVTIGAATVTVAGETMTFGGNGRIVGRQEGIDVGAISDGRFRVIGNTLIQGGVEGTGIAGGAGIEFEGAITNGAEIEILGNTEISGADNGIEFGDPDVGSSEAPVTSSTVTIAGNGIVGQGLRLRGDGIWFGSALTDATVVIGAAELDVDGDRVIEVDEVFGGNTITAARTGINVAGAVTTDTGTTAFTITGNTIGASDARVGADGIAFAGGITGSATVAIGGTDQTVYATDRAIDVVALTSPTTLSIAGGTYDATGGSLRVDNTGIAGTDGGLDLGTADFVGGTNSTVVEVVTTDGFAGVDVSFSGEATFDGGTTGIKLSGPGIDIVDDTLGSIEFLSEYPTYIELANGAEFQPGQPTNIDATNVTFNGVLGSAMTLAQMNALEDRLVHYADDNTLGLINTNFRYVIDGESIQLAVNAAGRGLLGADLSIEVLEGTFGGSVEVWVDGLTLTGQGDTTVIDTDAVDAYGNNGDVDNGFQVAAISDLSNGGDVTGVTIDGFSFDTVTSTGSTIGVELGEDGTTVSTAIGTTVQNSSFTDLANGIVANAVDGTTTISTVEMTGLASHGIHVLAALTSSDTVVIEDSEIASTNETVRFGSTLTGTSVTIAGNTLTSGVDGIQFDSTVTDATVLIGGAEDADANTIIADGTGINVAGTITNTTTGTTAVDIIGNTIGDAAGTVIGDQGILFNAITNTDADADPDALIITIAGNTIGGVDAGGDSLLSANGLLFNGALTDATVLIGGAEDADANTIIGGIDNSVDNGIYFTDDISGGRVLVVGNTRVSGFFGVYFLSTIDDATVVIAGNGGDATDPNDQEGLVGLGSFGDAVVFDDTLTDADVTIGAATVTVGGETMTFGGNGRIVGQSEGIDIATIEGGRFRVIGNTLIQGESGGAGIEFENDISDSAVIEVLGNATISGADHGIEFDDFDNFSFTAPVTSSTVTIAGNGIVGVGSTEGGDGIWFGSALTDATVLIGAAEVDVDGDGTIQSDEVFAGNTITAARNGINVEGEVTTDTGTTTFTITDNTIGSSASRVGADGIAFAGGITGTATVTIGGTNQTVYATDRAVEVVALTSPTTLSITGGTYDATGGSLRVDNTGVSGTDGGLDLGDAALVGGTDSTVVEVVTTDGFAGVDIDFSGDATFDGGATGLRLSGPGIDIVDDTLGSIAFTNQTGDYIELAKGAEFLPGTPTVIDATGVSFGGLLASAMTDAQRFALEGQLVHYLDTGDLGLLSVASSSVYAAQSIQLAVNAAGFTGAGEVLVLGGAGGLTDGAYGGSVEVWVDGLAVTGVEDTNGDGPVIDTDAVDAFANNGDVDNGFQVAAISDLSGGGDVTGVIIDGFAFTSTTAGANVGVELGEDDGITVSTAIGTTVQNSSFDDLLDGIVANAVDGTTTISTVGMTDLAGRGVHFLTALGASDTVVIEDSEITSAGDAVRFDGALVGTSLTIARNTLTATDVDVAGVHFDATLTEADVLIGGATAGDANTIIGDGEGLFFDSISGGTVTVAFNEQIRGEGGGGYGILVESIVDGAVFAVVGNTEIRGGDTGVVNGIDGIAIESADGSTIVIAGNEGIFADFFDAIYMTSLSDTDVTIGAATVTVDGTSIDFGGNGTILGVGNGVSISGVSGGTVNVAGNGLIQGIERAGIELGGIENDALVEIMGNTTIRSGDGNSVVGEDGIAIRGVDTSMIVIADNGDVIGSGDFPFSGNGILFEEELTDSDVTIVDNGTIVGTNLGVYVDSEMSGGTFVVARNDLIQGTEIAGVAAFRLSDGALFAVVGNTLIRSGDDAGIDGIDVFGADDSTIVIAGNEQILGNGEDAIYIEDVFGGDLTNNDIIIGPASVDVDRDGSIQDDENFGGNGQIVGAEDGINIGAISGGSVTVADNTTIEGTTGSGIEFEGTVSDGAVLTVSGNTEITAGEEGIDFDAAVISSIVEITGNADILGGTHGIAFLEAITDSIVSIDRNGTATQDGADYDGTAVVELDGFEIVGRVHGTDGSGITFADILGESEVTVSRTMITGSGTNGLTFAGIASTETTGVYNNFIRANEGDGVRFTGDIGGPVEVFQNYIVENGGDGVEVADTAAIDGGSLAVQVNFLPGTPFAFGNGGFGFNLAGTGSPDLEGNWWGTPAVGFAAVIDGVDGGDLPTLITIATGDEDANVSPAFGNTEFEMFAFQPAAIAEPLTNVLPELLPTDVETLLDEIRSAESELDRPGGASFFSNELGAPFQTNVFADNFSIGEVGGPGGLQPAAGGESRGPVNLGDLEPAAGPGSQQAQAEDTCVETYFADFWNVDSACQ